MYSKPPLFSIEQTINTYKYLFKPKPEFGMDYFSNNFEAKDIVLLDDVKSGTQGVPVRFNYYALFLRLEGITQRSINQFTYVIKPHALQLVNPGTIYSFKDASDTSRTYVLLFNEDFIQEGCLAKSLQDELFEFHKKHQEDILLDTALYAQVVFMYEQLSHELRAKRDDYKVMVKLIIHQLLFLLKREKEKKGLKIFHTRAEQISAEYLVLIEEHYWHKRSVNEYAKMLNITPKHLTQTIKLTLHHSALSYIHIRVIKEIQYLLGFTDLSITQISFALNFETLSLLGRFFKRYEGISPKRYRLKNKLQPWGIKAS